jgi:hypothetical protein
MLHVQFRRRLEAEDAAPGATGAEGAGASVSLPLLGLLGCEDTGEHRIRLVLPTHGTVIADAFLPKLLAPRMRVLRIAAPDARREPIILEAPVRRRGHHAVHAGIGERQLPRITSEEITGRFHAAARLSGAIARGAAIP